MTEIQHQHIERDQAALKLAEARYQAAKAKHEAAVAKTVETEEIKADAQRNLDAATERFHRSVDAAKVVTTRYSVHVDTTNYRVG